MSGDMRKRVPAASRDDRGAFKKLKGFHAPQKDNSKRQKRRAKLNNYNDQKRTQQ